MDVWSGSIALNEGPSLKGIKLRNSTSNGQVDIPKDSTLSLKCFVNPALVPLHARAGPNLELHSTHIETSQWLKNKLLSNTWLNEEDLEKFQSLQCPVGILIRVDNTGPRGAISTGCTISDFLIYGILSSAISFEHPATPPGSSSSDNNSQETSSSAVKRELRIYASPLSESLIAKAEALPSPPSTPKDDARTENAEFLPDLRSPSPKRKRVATLFEIAAQHHRRVRQKGGEAVSQLMANGFSRSQSSQQSQTLKIKRESEEPEIPALERTASQRGRSVSLGANSSTMDKPQGPLHAEPCSGRPSSNRGLTHSTIYRRGTPKPFLMKSSERMEASPAFPLPEHEKKANSPSAPKNGETIIAENKHLITRTILTCMRLFGYNRTTSSRSTSISKSATTPRVTPGLDETEGTTPATATTAASGITEEDDFKAMYHATYRASTFALRKYLKESPSSSSASLLPPLLNKEKAMTLIDEFLRLFCEEH